MFFYQHGLGNERRNTGLHFLDWHRIVSPSRWILLLAHRRCPSTPLQKIAGCAQQHLLGLLHPFQGLGKDRVLSSSTRSFSFSCCCPCPFPFPFPLPFPLPFSSLQWSRNTIFYQDLHPIPPHPQNFNSYSWPYCQVDLLLPTELVSKSFVSIYSNTSHVSGHSRQRTLPEAMWARSSLSVHFLSTSSWLSHLSRFFKLPSFDRVLRRCQKQGNTPPRRPVTSDIGVV